MNNLLTIMILINASISIITLSREMISKIKDKKEKREYANKLLALEEKINSEQYEMIFRNNCYDIKTKSVNENLLKKQVNSYKMYMTLKYSADYFSKIYKNNDIFCEVKINVQDYFKTIARYSSIKKGRHNVMTDKFYYIEKNTDLMYIYENNYSKFLITNIMDYNKKNQFLLQDERLKEYCKAILTLPIYKNEMKNEILACYTICFSKPLDEKIKIKKFDYVVDTLVIELKKQIEEYALFNQKELYIDKENKNTTDGHLQNI